MKSKRVHMTLTGRKAEVAQLLKERYKANSYPEVFWRLVQELYGLDLERLSPESNVPTNENKSVEPKPKKSNSKTLPKRGRVFTGDEPNPPTTPI